MAGGLFDPLGTDRAAPARPRMPPTAPTLALVVAIGAAATLIGTAWLRDDGDRGQPRAVSPIVPAPASPAPVPPPVPLPAAETASPATLPTQRDDQEVEIQNGVRIVRPRRDRSSPGGQTIRVPDAAGRPVR